MRRLLIVSYVLYALAASLSIWAILSGGAHAGAYLITAVFSTWRMGVIDGATKSERGVE